MEKPRIDILVPTFNPNPEFLRQALDSILHQTEQRFRVFINDDASDIDVENILKPYLSDPRFSFRRNVKRLGIGGNWNACLNTINRSSDSKIAAPTNRDSRIAAPGSLDCPFVQFLFQDDRWYFNYLREMLTIFDKNPTVGFVSADHLYECEKNIPTEPIYENLRTFKNDHLAPGLHQGEAFLRWWLNHQLHPNVIGEPSFVMMRRDVIEQIGLFREDMPQFLDVEYWTRLLLKTHWYYHPEELGVFRVHRKAASFVNDEQGLGLLDRLRCFTALKTNAPCHLHPMIEDARNVALKGMVQKFFDRIAHKKNIHTKGSGMFPCFCLRHPILMGKTVMRVVWEKWCRSSPSQEGGG